MVVLGFMAAVASVLVLWTAAGVLRDTRPSVAEQVAANLQAFRGPVAVVQAEPNVEVNRPSPARVAAVAASAAGLNVGKHMAMASLKTGLLTAKIGGKIGFALLKASLKK